MFHIYYTEFVAYKSWNNILIVFYVIPPWLSGKALDKKFSLFLLYGRPLVRILAETNIFGHFLAKN